MADQDQNAQKTQQQQEEEQRQHDDQHQRRQELEAQNGDQSQPDDHTQQQGQDSTQNVTENPNEVEVPNDHRYHGARGAQGNPAQPEEAPNPDDVPLGQASAAPQGENTQIYSDTATSQDGMNSSDPAEAAKRETDAQREALGMDAEEMREKQTEFEKQQSK